MWISKELDITVQNVEKSHKDSQNRLINSDENWYKLEWKTNLVNQTLYKRKTWLSKSLKVASWIKKSGKKKDPTLVMGKKLTQILIKICFTTNMCRQLTQHYSKLAPIYMPPPPQKKLNKNDIPQQLISCQLQSLFLLAILSTLSVNSPKCIKK